MKTELDIKKLIEETQTLCHDGMIEIAAMGERNVQVMEAENGSKFQLSVKLEVINIFNQKVKL